ncbi:MAG: TonB-dependent receptor [Weeksellaceae bacterium]|nr:TonB-dependent receptor [Weeksellaceae bacterium]
MGYFLLFFIAFSTLAFSQTILVRDAVTGAALEGVEVSVVSDSLSTELGYTNNVGRFYIPIIQSEAEYTFYYLDYMLHSVSGKEILASAENTIMLERNIFQLADIAVHGVQWSQKMSNIPQHVISLSAKDIFFINKPTTADLLESSGEVFMQKSQMGGGSPMLRGFAANRLLLMIDGVRINNAIFRSGNLHNIIAIDPFSLNDIRVITGPGSVLFGSDAIGGVLQFNTSQISTTDIPEITGRVFGRASTAAREKSGGFTLQYSGKKFAANTSYTFTEFNNLRQGKNGPDDYLRNEYVLANGINDQVIQNENPLIQRLSGYHQHNFMQKFYYEPSKNENFTYTFNYALTSDLPRYDALLQRRNGQLRFAEWYYGPQTWMLNALKYQRSMERTWADEAEIQLYHQYFKESRHNRAFRNQWRHNQYEEVQVAGLEATFFKKIGSKHNLIYGLEIFNNWVTSTANRISVEQHTEQPIATRYPNGAKWGSAGAYFQWDHQISQNVNMESSIRYSHFISTMNFENDFYDFPFDEVSINNGALNGSLGMNFTPRPNLGLRGSISSGFRSPNIDDMAKVFDSEPGKVVVPNPELKPEYIYNGEAGITWRYKTMFQLGATAYYSYMPNAIVRRDGQFLGSDQLMYQGTLSQVQTLQNAAFATVYGGFFSLETNFTRNVKGLVKLNYTQGTEELEDGTTAPLRHAAPTFGNLGLVYQRKNAKLYLEYFFNGEVSADRLAPSEVSKPHMYALDGDGRPYVPAWYTINMRLQVQITEYLTISTNAENLLDRRYRSYSSGISAPGRNFVISMMVAF